MNKIGEGVREKKIAIMDQQITMVSIVSDYDYVCDVVFGVSDGNYLKMNLGRDDRCDIEGSNSENLSATVL